MIGVIAAAAPEDAPGCTETVIVAVVKLFPEFTTVTPPTEPVAAVPEVFAVKTSSCPCPSPSIRGHGPMLQVGIVPVRVTPKDVLNVRVA